MQAVTLADVEPYQQIAHYSCGAAALKAVLKHWGEDVVERILIREIGVDPETGSTADQVARAARARGYAARVHRFSSIDELATYTNRGVPVIVAIRSFTRPDQGHFVVATRVNSHVEIMDPNVRGNRRVLTRREMDRRWRFRDYGGVIVQPRQRQRRTLSQVDSSRARAVALVVGLGAVVGAIIVAGMRR